MLHIAPIIAEVVKPSGISFRFAGRNAAANGDDYASNPYVAGSVEYHAWAMGWWDHNDFAFYDRRSEAREYF